MPDQPDVSHWLKRIESEYREMPGLQLTEHQMRRLWGLDAATCALIIAALVGSGVLCEVPKHGYSLAISHSRRP
jgi:hypothetical protein